jgi:hypothetical protein
MAKQPSSNPFLVDLADFAGPAIVTREVTFRGKKKNYQFRDLPQADIEKLFLKAPNATDDGGKGLRARVLAAVMADEQGNPVMTAEEAGQINNQLAKVLAVVAFDVNGLSPESKEEAGNAPSE